MHGWIYSIPKLAQYHMVLKYKPGATNHADALSRWPDYEVEGNPDNEDITVLPEKYFCNTHTSIRVMDWNSVENTLEQAIKRAQYPMQQTLKQWTTTHNLSTIDGTHWYHGCYSLFRSIVLSLLIQTYPQRVFNYLRIICTTGLFTSCVYSHACMCKHLLDLSVI